MYRQLHLERGDPGFFGSLIRGIGGLVTGGPIAAIGAVLRPNQPRLPQFPGGGGPVAPWGISMPGTGNNPGMYAPYPGMQTGLQIGGGGPPATFTPLPTIPGAGGGTIVSPGGTTAMVPKGYHVNKALIRAQVRATPGNVRRAAQVVHAIVKNQHMNPLNPRALRRASRRAHGFIKFARHIVGYYQAKKPKGRPYIKHRRKR